MQRKRERLRLNRTNIAKLDTEAATYEIADNEMPPFRLRVAPSGTKTFILRYRNAENRTRVLTIARFPDLTPEQARDIARKKLYEVKVGEDPAAKKQEARRKAERERYLSLGGFLDRKYGPWVTTNRKSGHETLRMLKAIFADLADTNLDEITPWIIEKWRKRRLEEGRAVSTINRNLTALKAALSTAVDWGLIEQHPLDKVKLGRVDAAGKVRYLSDDEERRLREALDARDREIREARARGNAWRLERGQKLMPEIGVYGDHLTPLVLISINTGARRGELFNLHWSDVDLGRASLTIEGAGAKSGGTRHVPLNDEAVRVLKTWRNQTSGQRYVFPAKDGGRLDNVRKSWAGVLEAARIEAFRWHDLRHTFASKLVMAGVDLNTVRELLGHSDIKMTLRYAHLAPEHKAAAVARLVR